MKKLFLFSLIMVFVLASTVVYAAEKAPLGIGNLALKLDYMNFSDSDLENLGVDDSFYIGLEGYGEIARNLYLGAEVGYANPDSKIKIEGVKGDIDLTYIPIELNLKYAIKPNPNIVIDFGAGLSYNYLESKISGRGISDSGNDWLFGGQIFVDANYTINQFFLGLSAKYQITDDFEDWDFNGSNLRIGGQIGVMF